MKQKIGYGVFIGTTGPQFSEISNFVGIPHTSASTMEQAVELAYKYARVHAIEVILLSPGCASFDMFKDYLDRAHHFVDAVNSIH